MEQKPKNTMELLIDSYINPAPIVEEAPKQAPRKKVIEEVNTSSRAADVLELKAALAASNRELTKAGIELNQLPTDVTKRMFEKYENIMILLGRLQGEVDKALNS